MSNIDMLLNQVKNKLMRVGLGPSDPAINSVLGKLSMERDSDKLQKIANDLLALSDDELKDKLNGKRRNIEEKQRAVEDDKLKEQQKQAELAEQARVQREMQERDITFNPEFNTKLSKLVSDLKNVRNEAQGKFVGLPKEFFKEIPNDKLPQILEYLENELGFEFKSRTHGTVEQEGRSVEEETITKDDLLNGDVKAVIPTEKLQTKEFEGLLDGKGKDLDEKAIEVATKGVEKVENEVSKEVDEDEMSL